MTAIFDADCGCLGIGGKQKRPVESDDLFRSMDRLRIDRALVRYEPMEIPENVARRNDALFELAGRDGRVSPCPAVVPSAGFDTPAEEIQVAGLIGRGARAVTLCPAEDYWLTEPFVCERLFTALQARRLPVVVPAASLPPGRAAALAARFPGLPLVLTGLAYRSARDVGALLDSFANVHVSLGHNYCIQGIVEWLVNRHGPGRFVLGTGFPAADPACAVTHLVYARITDEEKAMIGQGTMARLTSGVVT